MGTPRHSTRVRWSAPSLVVATGDGALHLTRVEWRGVPMPPPAAGAVF